MLSSRSKQFILIGVLTHLLAAYFSVGFYNLDEQTQVLNLVGFKLGHYGVNALSDQYVLAIRSWLHPAIYLFCSKILLFFFNFNPFIHAFFYRLLSTSVGMLALWTLYKTFEEEIKELKALDLFFFFLGLLWFFPFLHARPANENLCASFFIFGLYFLKKKESAWSVFVAGILFSITFVIRFQMVVMITSTVLWFMITKKEFKKIFILIVGGILTLALSTFFDAYMYGHFTFTPYNYVNLNLVAKYANGFGVTPIYQYFIFCFRECLPPLGIMVVLSFVYFWIKFPKSLITAITLPFFMVHSLIGHKEFRFIFPMAPFLPLILIYVCNEFNLQKRKYFRNAFLIFNLPLLLYFSFTPAGSTNRILKFLYEKEIPVEKVYVFSPHEDFSRFFFKKEIEYAVIKNNEVKDLVAKNPQSFFLTKSLVERDLVLENKNCQTTFTLYPEWIYQLEFIKKRRTFRSWSFVECRN